MSMSLWFFLLMSFSMLRIHIILSLTNELRVFSQLLYDDCVYWYYFFLMYLIEFNSSSSWP